jgi:hypothetical protein
VRLGISHVLDAIEKKLSTDPTATGAVVDLGEVVRLAELDGGRPAYLLRLGLLVDLVGRHLCDDGISVYAVADRALLSDTDLTANEKIVIRRWSDDGLIEIVPKDGPPAAERAREVAALTGLPLISRQADKYSGLTYAPAVAGNTITLVPKMLGPGPAAPAPILGRRWRCPESYCPSFGDTAGNGGGSGRDSAKQGRPQPPAQLRGGVPYCPRHGEKLTDLGPAPRAVALAVKVNNIVWHRFVVTEAAPVVVGRAPEDPDGVIIGLTLDERGLRWVSRTHVQLELRGHRLSVTDLSTNGTTLLRRTSPGEQPRRSPMQHGESSPIAEWDTVEVYEGIELGRAIRSAGPAPGAPTDSVMTEAPTTRIG